MRQTSSGDGEDDHVLRPENLAEHDELALDDVHHQQRIAVDGDERPGEHDRQQQPAEPGAPAVKPAADLARINPLAPAIGSAVAMWSRKSDQSTALTEDSASLLVVESGSMEIYSRLVCWRAPGF